MVTAPIECRLEFLKHQKYFAIVAAGFMFRLDIDRAYVSAVLPAGQIGSGRDVHVIETQSRRPGRKAYAAHAMRWNKGRSLFGCAIHIHRNGLAMPVQLLRRIGVVVDINNDLLAFLEAQQGAGKLPVISGGGNDTIRCQFNEPMAHPENRAMLVPDARFVSTDLLDCQRPVAVAGGA
jgi:hypothetical protein